MKIALVNPNTNAATTDVMVAIARRKVPESGRLDGLTAPFGAPLITNETALNEAAEAVLSLSETLTNYDGVIVAAFGDPGLIELRQRLNRPVVGIAEASMQLASTAGRRFAVATTTPDLRQVIAAKAAAIPGGRFVGTWITPGDPHQIMADQKRLIAALHDACTLAMTEGGAEAVIIGGGPLGNAAEALRTQLPIPVIAPIPTAVDLLLSQIRERT
jgi:allantoin racemase